eukprot:UN24425
MQRLSFEKRPREFSGSNHFHQVSSGSTKCLHAVSCNASFGKCLKRKLIKGEYANAREVT